MIFSLMQGWVSDDDIAAIQRILAGVVRLPNGSATARH